MSVTIAIVCFFSAVARSLVGGTDAADTLHVLSVYIILPLLFHEAISKANVMLHVGTNNNNGQILYFQLLKYWLSLWFLFLSNLTF